MLVQPTVDPAQLLSWKVAAWTAIVTAVLGVITAALAVWQAAAATRQRKRESRAKQAELARSLQNEAFDYPASASALDLLDDGEARFEYLGESIAITEADIERALFIRMDGNGEPQLASDAVAKATRRCFDALFHYFDRFERLLNADALTFEDVETPWEWYTTQMARHRKIFAGYARFIRYDKANTFMSRFSVWRSL